VFLWSLSVWQRCLRFSALKSKFLSDFIPFNEPNSALFYRKMRFVFWGLFSSFFTFCTAEKPTEKAKNLLSLD
jgi:hypothetical protein